MLVKLSTTFLFILGIFFSTSVMSQGNTCATATTLTAGATCTYTAGTTVGASYENDAANGGTPGCASPGAPDVWYTFTTTVAGNYTFDTNTGTITDGGMALYSGTCGSLTQIACDDDSSPNGSMPMITATLAAATTYKIRVWKYSTGTGTFSICATTPPPPPANDDCATAVSLTQQAAGSCTATAGTVLGATNSGVASCTGTPDDDVWYSFVATATYAQVNRTTTGGWDSGVEVFQSIGAAPGSCIGASMGCQDAETAYSFSGLTVGRRYYVRVYTWGANTTPATPGFTICITTPPPPPANDNCSTATTLTQQATGSCTTTAGTVANATPSVGIANCTGTADDDVWYVFTATNVAAVINRTTAGGWDSGIEIFSSTGASPGTCIGSSLGCQDAETGFTVTGLAVGMNYYVRVYSWSSAFTPGTPGFTICITTPTITTTNISACSGNFYDSGGSGGAYGNNEIRVTTICPSTAGSKARVTFSSFATENGVDYLQIFDGNSTSAPSLGVYTGTSSPGIVSATPSNASGCLTFVFSSDAATTAAGWASVISCYVPCQTITANLVSTNPASGGGGIIRVCQGQSVNFVGSGTFSTSGAGATYSWNMGNGVSVSGTNINYTYPAAGSYLVNLLITDPSGCTNSNSFNKNVQVSTTPTITTSATPSTLCTNQTSALSANITMTPYTVNCTPPVSGTTFLPDGSGVSYTTSITTNCYSPTATVTAATDINNVCLTMEHSYLGDLNIRIICPNGQSTVLKAYADGGGGLYLGAAIDDVTSGPGTGATYCFTPSAVTLLVNGTTVTAGSPASNSVAAGNYMPTQPFTNLIGCPLNGNWTIEVTDNLALDDGYIFNWDVNFAASVNAASFTPTIASQGWVAATNLTVVNATSANVTPTNQGTPCYTYSLTDNFGCTYTTSQCITVNCGASLPVGLISFDATAVSSDRVKLEWKTSTEINSDYFLVERSLDGESWEEVGTVEAAGNSEEELSYVLHDNNPFSGTSYYRLLQFDLNGTVGTTDIEAVYLNISDQADLILFPNPSSSLITVKGDAVALSKFEVIDVTGKNLRGSLPSYEQGDNSIVLDVSALAKGVYTVKCGSRVISFTKN